MLCKNKLTNLVFKNQENSAKTQFASFFFPIFFNVLNKEKTPRMKYMNVMQCNSQRQKEKHKKPKNKEQWSQREKQ